MKEKYDGFGFLMGFFNSTFAKLFKLRISSNGNIFSKEELEKEDNLVGYLIIFLPSSFQAIINLSYVDNFDKKIENTIVFDEKNQFDHKIIFFTTKFKIEAKEYSGISSFLIYKIYKNKEENYLSLLKNLLSKWIIDPEKQPRFLMYFMKDGKI